MLKSILKLEGVQGLSKNEQKEINGGITIIHTDEECDPIINIILDVEYVVYPCGFDDSDKYNL